MKQERRKQINEIFNKVFERDDISALWDKSLDENDINSLNFINFIVAFEDVFKVEVNNKYLDIGQYETTGQMIETLEKIIED